jgi:two-component system chemotaxis response regulator CheY
MILKCLIVEDSAFMREIYRYSLAANINLQIVAEAQDGVQALKLIKEIQPDILILDLVLPLKNGFDVLREMAVVSPKTKVVVISSLDDDSSILKAKALGAIVYLKKPFTKIELLDAINEVSKFYAGVDNG